MKKVQNPAAVVFDAVKAAIARKWIYSSLIQQDVAYKANLMTELNKFKELLNVK